MNNDQNNPLTLRADTSVFVMVARALRDDAAKEKSAARQHAAQEESAISNQAQDAAMFRMMIRTGMVRIWEDEKEIRVEICANPGSSCGLFKSAVPSADTIPRATIAAHSD